jgi:hypothetical protein
MHMRHMGIMGSLQNKSMSTNHLFIYFNMVAAMGTLLWPNFHLSKVVVIDQNICD